jgi:hypothetical protein
MRLIESFLESKLRDSSICEDALFEGDNFLAVIDGATDKTDALYNEVPGGRFAAQTLVETLGHVAPDLTAKECIATLTSALHEAIEVHSPVAAPEDLPSASVVIYSVARSEIWRVGDCSWACDGTARIGKKPIDKIVAAARAAMLEALLQAGAGMGDLLETDPGRAMVLPLLSEQYRFRNLEDPSCELSFGALDGKPVPDRFIEVAPVPPGTEVILASDGYPQLEPTLAETEAVLARDLEEDPLRIGRYKSTKGVAPGQISFDDRAFVRFRT